MTSALRTRIPLLRAFVGTLKAPFANIRAFGEHDLQNAVAEGFKCIIRIVKNRAREY
jgi:transposase